MVRSERWSDAGLVSYSEGFSFTPSETKPWEGFEQRVIGSDLFLRDH